MDSLMMKVAKKKATDLKTQLKEQWAQLAFAILFGVGIIADLILALNGHLTISSRVWEATQSHPTLIAAGVLLGIGVGWLLRKSWPAVLMWGILVGHLFIHW